MALETTQTCRSLHCRTRYPPTPGLECTSQQSALPRSTTSQHSSAQPATEPVISHLGKLCMLPLRHDAPDGHHLHPIQQASLECNRHHLNVTDRHQLHVTWLHSYSEIASQHHLLQTGAVCTVTTHWGCSSTWPITHKNWFRIDCFLGSDLIGCSSHVILWHIPKPAHAGKGSWLQGIGYGSLAENMARFPKSGVLPLSLTTQQEEVMGRICFVYGCSHWSDREKCSFFHFPTHVVQRGRWERLCR